MSANNWYTVMELLKAMNLTLIGVFLVIATLIIYAHGGTGSFDLVCPDESRFMVEDRLWSPGVGVQPRNIAISSPSAMHH